MKSLILRHYKAIFPIFLGVLILLSFYGGMLYGKQEGTSEITLSCSDEVLSALSIQTSQNQTQKPLAPKEIPASSESILAPEMVSSGKYVGSKNGTKYYLPNCSTVKRIKPENYRWFQSAEEAELQGYTPGSC